MKNFKIFSELLLVIAITFFTTNVSGQDNTSGDWRFWGSGPGSLRYSNLDQINLDNAEDLDIAWRWNSANFGPNPEYYYRTTPIAINGILYAAAGERRAVIAIDGATGETIWIWRMKQTKRWEVSPRRFSGRGVAMEKLTGRVEYMLLPQAFFLLPLMQ